MRFREKVAVITGAGSGMGKSMAERFAAEGGRVVCADRSGKQEEVAAAIGNAAIAVQADVAVSAEVQRMIAAAEQHFGRLDVLCNNAGFGGPRKPLAEQSEETFDDVHGVNLKGVFLGMKYGIPAMLRSGGGAIVNTASSVALSVMKDHSIYAAAKAGVVQLTRTAAVDYAEQGIRVNAVCPGMTWTGLVPMSAEIPEPPTGTPIPPGTPMNRWGLAREVAAIALFLASDEASYITGAIVPVDGGMSL